jgi:hypothetical protein
VPNSLLPIVVVLSLLDEEGAGCRRSSERLSPLTRRRTAWWDAEQAPWSRLVLIYSEIIFLLGLTFSAIVSSPILLSYSMVEIPPAPAV